MNIYEELTEAIASMSPEDKQDLLRIYHGEQSLDDFGCPMEIKELYQGFEAVFIGRACIGVVVPSRKYPFKKMFFCYEDACFYYGMTSEAAVDAYYIDLIG